MRAVSFAPCVLRHITHVVLFASYKASNSFTTPTAAMLNLEGVVYKPLQGASTLGAGKTASRGDVERIFYETICNLSHPLANHLPEFLGVETLIADDGVERTYLKMEDMTHKFKKPCILDLKMGTQTYPEGATPEKIAREEAKYPPQKEIGFRFVGLTTYQVESDTYATVSRDYCMSIQPGTVKDGLVRYLHNGVRVRYDIIPDLKAKVEAVRKTLVDHPHCRLYGSSLLICYEGDPTTADTGASRTDVKMIDFAHAYPIADGGHDTGYIQGIDFLLETLHEIYLENQS